MDLTRTLQHIDQFRVVSRDLTSGTFSGHFFGLLGWAALIFLVLLEIIALGSSQWESVVTVDDTQQDDIVIHFDISMLELPCNHLKLFLWDKFGEERIPNTNTFTYQPIAHGNNWRTHKYSDDELKEMGSDEMEISEEMRKELDADWGSTHDSFKHQDFHAAVTLHDFTFVNFYADWCIHCRQFHPTWEKAAEQISEKVTYIDATGNPTTVKFLKMNCVDFSKECQDQGIAAFPTLRLYKKDGTLEMFKAKRNMEQLVQFLRTTISNSHSIVKRHHSQFKEGCRVSGHLEVARTPGHFHLQVESKGDETINAALTNVSHRVDQFFFSDPGEQWLYLEGAKGRRRLQRKFGIPQRVFDSLTPLMGMTFAVEHFHEAPQHYLKVVTTKFSDKRAYAFTHTDRVRKFRKTVEKNMVPQARFTYDFTPMSVLHRASGRRWYDFLTRICAICGGSFAIMQIIGGAADSLERSVKNAMGKGS